MTKFRSRRSRSRRITVNLPPPTYFFAYIPSTISHHNSMNSIACTHDQHVRVAAFNAENSEHVSVGSNIVSKPRRGRKMGPRVVQTCLGPRDARHPPSQNALVTPDATQGLNSDTFPSHQPGPVSTTAHLSVGWCVAPISKVTSYL